MTSAAFCSHDRVKMDGAMWGPLGGISFAVKDLFAVEGVTACFGNPTWLATHEPATRTAPVVLSLLRAGATLVGLTITDEMALSLTGENAHYGTPVNSRRPDRVPGGSSSGSAAAVAAGACAFALGTDTGGSVRVPASHCGIYGFRPTHGVVSTDGVLPLAPRFDTVGWFARDARTLARVGEVLLPPAARQARPRGLLTAPALARLLDPKAGPAFAMAAAKLSHHLGCRLDSVDLEASVPADAWLPTYLALQNAEMASTHRPWIEQQRPAFGSLIAGRVARALAVTADEVEDAEAVRDALVARVDAILAGGAWLVWPSAAGAAPPRGLPDAQTDAIAGRALTLSALASLCGLPQVSLPDAEVDGCPFGISLIGPRGSDRALLAAVRAVQSPS
ncbi:MAG TPA: amidase [Polyangia bacterium]|nr:amidase [Polyangia bacterium]